MEALILFLLLPTLFSAFTVTLWLLVDVFIVRKLRDLIKGVGDSDE